MPWGSSRATTFVAAALVVVFGAALWPAARGADDRAGAVAAATCSRPYTATSPWNTPIPRTARYEARSPAHVRALGGPLTSDPTQFTYPVYVIDDRTPRRAVQLDGRYSSVTGGGRRLRGLQRATVRIPIPDAARQSAGDDAQIILIDPVRGDEWGLWRAAQGPGGRWTATNGYHYNTRWSGVPPSGFGSRGAGVPYLAGLVRPCEIRRGRIDHALAFAYDYPTARHVRPATKSDGGSTHPDDVPEGARFQLDPSITDADLRRRGCGRACRIIARALQRYGMYVIDNSGRPKIMLEYEGTARWRGLVSEHTAEAIPMRRLRLLELR